MTEIFRAEGPDIAFLSACYQKTEDALDQEAAAIRAHYLQQDPSLRLFLSYRNGRILGFIQGFPADHPLSLVRGADLYTAGCVFAPGGIKGTGKNLLLRLEDEARTLGYRGMALIAFDGSDHMPVGFFRKLGYDAHKRHGNAHIMVKSFGAGGTVEADFVIPQRPVLAANTVHAFYSPLCFASIKHALQVRDIARQKGILCVLHDGAAEGEGLTEGVYWGRRRIAGDLSDLQEPVEHF